MVVWVYEGTGASATKKPLIDPIAYIGGARTPVNEIHAYEANFKRTLVWSRTPLELSVDVTRWDTAVLTWTMPGAGADTFRVKRDGQQIYSGTAMTYTNINLFPDRSYTYTVEALRAAAVVSTDSETVRTDARTMTLAVTGSTHNSVSLEWTDPVPGSVAAYQIMRDGAQLVALGAGGALTWTDSNNLAYNKTYTYQVRAYRSGVEILPASNTVDVALTARPPMVLTGTSPGWDGMSLTWTDLGGQTTADVAFYMLQRGSTVLSTTISNTARAYDDLGALLPGTDYTYTLTAKGPYDVTVASTTATLTTAARTAVAVTAVAQSFSSIKVDWPDAGQRSITKYELYHYPHGGGWSLREAASTDHTHTDTGLAASTAYHYLVRSWRGTEQILPDFETATDPTTPARTFTTKTYVGNCTSSCSYTGDPNWTPKVPQGENSRMYFGDAGSDTYNTRVSAAIWAGAGGIPDEVRNCKAITKVRCSFRIVHTPNATSASKASIGMGMSSQNYTNTWPASWPSSTGAFATYTAYRGTADVWLNGTEWIDITTKSINGKTVAEHFRTYSSNKDSMYWGLALIVSGHNARDYGYAHASKTSAPTMRPRIEITYQVWD